MNRVFRNWCLLAAVVPLASSVGAQMQTGQKKPGSAATMAKLEASRRVAVPQAAQKTRTKIVNGIPAETGDLPWQVSLFRSSSGHFCGGSLIDPQWVLTAAHCVVDDVNPPQFQILSGTADLQAGGTISDVDKVIVHEGYVADSHINDIALVKLAAPVTTADRTTRTLRPEQPVDGALRQIVGPLTVSGFGVTQEDGDISPHLLMARIQQVPNRTCNTQSFYGRRDHGNDDVRGQRRNGLLSGR